MIVNRLTWNRTRDDRLEGGSYIRLTMSPCFVYFLSISLLSTGVKPWGTESHLSSKLLTLFRVAYRCIYRFLYEPGQRYFRWFWVSCQVLVFSDSSIHISLNSPPHQGLGGGYRWLWSGGTETSVPHLEGPTECSERSLCIGRGLLRYHWVRCL